MAEVWLHHNPGFWYVTSDGLHEIDRVQEIWLKDVRFVIDPIGEKRARELRRRVTYAWAVGQIIDEPTDIPKGSNIRLKQQGGFCLETDDGAWLGISGCFRARFAIWDRGRGYGIGWQPVLGPAERRHVQQYGRQK